MFPLLDQDKCFPVLVVDHTLLEKWLVFSKSCASLEWGRKKLYLLLEKLKTSSNNNIRAYLNVPSFRM